MLDKKTVTEVAMIVNYQISKTGSACQHITREEAMLMEPIRISPAGGDFILALQKRTLDDFSGFCAWGTEQG